MFSFPLNVNQYDILYPFFLFKKKKILLTGYNKADVKFVYNKMNKVTQFLIRLFNEILTRHIGTYIRII